MKFFRTSKQEYDLSLKFRRSKLLSVLLILGVLAAPGAQATSARGVLDATAASPYTWATEVVDGPPFFYMMTDRSLRFEKSGLRRPCVAYGGDHLYYSCLNSGSNTWTTDVVDSNPMVGAYAALAFNSFNVPFISYYDALNAKLKLAFKPQGAIAWVQVTVDEGLASPPAIPAVPLNFVEPLVPTAEQEAEAASTYWDELWAVFPHLNIFAPGFLFGKIGVGKHTSIDIGADNIVHVSYYDETHGALKHAYWNLNNFPALPITEFADWRHDGDLGLWTSITVDDLNRPQISYMDEKYDDLRHAIKNGDTWDVRVVDDGVNVGPFSSIAIRPVATVPDLYPSIVYMSFNFDTNHYALRYAHLQNDNTTWTKGVIDGSTGVGLFASLTISDDGVYRVSYYDGLKGDLLYRTSSNGTSWGSGNVVASVGNQGLFTSIAFDPNNDPAIAYVDATNGLYKMSYKPTNTWLTAASIGATGNVGLNSSLAITNSGVPHISYLNETRGQLKHAWTVAANWTTEVITHTANLGTSNAIDVTSLDIPKVAYYDNAEGELRLSTRLSAWQETVVDSYRDVGAFVSMALDTSNNPHMSYVDQTQDRLMYARWDVGASDWITETREYEGIGGYTSLALNGLGLFGQQLWAISYYDFANEDIKLTYMGQGGTPQIAQIYSLGIPNDSIQILEPYSSVDFDSLGRMHVAFYDEVTGNLRYGIFTHPGTLQLSVVDGVGNPNILDVGRWVDLVIDPVTDHRHMCYYDTTNGSLKYAYWDGVSWSFDIVDGNEAVNPGDVGMYCSIDLNAAGEPGISYYDASNADLKFARTYPLPVLIPTTIFIPLVIQ